MTQTPIQTEKLHSRKIPWSKRLWFRAVGILLLISVVSLTAIWWPRRTMLSVWNANGTVFCESRRKPAYDLMVQLGIMQTVWGSKNWSNHYALLSGTGLDRDVTGVVLQKSQVEDDWLVHLTNLPQLKYVDLHDRQLGAGLEVLKRIPSFNHLAVTAAANQHLKELRRLPDLEQLSLWSPQSGDIGLESLSSLTKLRSLLIDGSRNTDQILKSLPDIPTMEEVVFQNCSGFTDDDLNHLQRFPNLKYLDLVKCGPINDEGLRQLGQLKNVETLAIRKSSGHITDQGLEALKDLSKLKKLYVIRGDFTVGQLKKLEELLPQAVIQEN